MTSQDKVAIGPIDDIAISLIGLSAAGELPVASAGVTGGVQGAPWLSGVADEEKGGRP